MVTECVNTKFLFHIAVLFYLEHMHSLIYKGLSQSNNLDSFMINFVDYEGHNDNLNDNNDDIGYYNTSYNCSNNNVVSKSNVEFLESKKEWSEESSNVKLRGKSASNEEGSCSNTSSYVDVDDPYSILNTDNDGNSSSSDEEEKSSSSEEVEYVCTKQNDYKHSSSSEDEEVEFIGTNLLEQRTSTITTTTKKILVLRTLVLFNLKLHLMHYQVHMELQLI